MHMNSHQYVSPLCDVSRYSIQKQIPFERLAVSIQKTSYGEDLCLIEISPNLKKDEADQYMTIHQIKESAKNDKRLELVPIESIYLIVYRLGDSPKVVARLGTSESFGQNITVRYFSNQEKSKETSH